jgi:hypothetical protein
LNSANSASSSANASFDAAWNRGFGERFGLLTVGLSKGFCFSTASTPATGRPSRALAQSSWIFSISWIMT